MAAARSKPRICLVPRLTGLGGPVSFQAKLAAGLAARGVEVTFDPADTGCQAALVTGGTYHLEILWRLRRRGVRLVQRLDGMNWIHRKRRTGLRHFLRSEANNLVLAMIRRRLADRIVYQSQFSKEWWERVRGPLPVPDRVIYNGVDLSAYSPEGPHSRPEDCYRLLMVEGHLGGGNETGLENGIRLAEILNQEHRLPVELCVVGEVPASLREASQGRLGPALRWAGVVPRERIPETDRSAHLLFSADLNAACPNAVIEALACGLPVVAFDTGALGELVRGGAGKVVPYGSNHWNLEPPDIPALARAAAEILAGLPDYRQAARRRAEAAFGLDRMVDQYLEFLL